MAGVQVNDDRQTVALARGKKAPGPAGFNALVHEFLGNALLKFPQVHIEAAAHRTVFAGKAVNSRVDENVDLLR